MSMKTGSLLKYYRTKANLTQSELAEGICSIPHLSKIENNHKEANQETVKLLFERLHIDLQVVENDMKQIKSLITRFIEHMEYFEEEEAGFAFVELEKRNELITFTPYIYLYELYKYRYFLFIKNLEKADNHRKWLYKQRKNFSQHESYLFSYYHGIHLILRGEFNDARDQLLQLLHDDVTNPLASGELYYHIALVKGSLEKSGQAIFYGKKALQLFTNQYNFKRIIHTLMLLAINYTHAGIYQEALDCYKHIIRNVKLLKETSLLPRIYNNLGYLKHKMGLHEESLYYYKLGLNMQTPGTVHYLISLYTVAQCYHDLNSGEAKAFFEEVYALSKELNNLKYQYLSIYYLHMINGDEDVGFKYLENKIIPYLESIGEHREELHYFSNQLSKYYKRLGKFEIAIKYIEMEGRK